MTLSRRPAKPSEVCPAIDQGNSRIALSFGGAFEVEGEEALQDLGVGEVGGPAVGGEDGGVEGGVGVVEPGGSLVVQVGEGPLVEFGGIEAGRVEPAVAQLDESVSRLPYPPALLVRRSRERESLERRCWRVTGSRL